MNAFVKPINNSMQYILCTIIILNTIYANAQWDERFNTTNISSLIGLADIRAVAAHNDNYYIGGMFKYFFAANDSVESLVVFDKVNRQRIRLGQPNEPNGLGFYMNGSWAQGNAIVTSLYVDGDDLWIGGTFNRAGNTEAWGIVRYNIPSKTWHSINSASNFPLQNVYSIQRYNHQLFIAGDFIASGNDTVNHLLKYDLNTQQFSPIVAGGNIGANNRIHKLLVADNKLFVGGYFTSIAGITANKIAYLDLTNNTWHPMEISGNNGLTGATVFDLAYENDTLFIAGSFTQAFGQPAKNFAYLNLSNLALTTPSINFNHDVRSIVKHQNKVYLAGLFNLPRQGFMVFDLSLQQFTNPWSVGPFTNAQPYPLVYSMDLSNDELIVGGNFNKIQGIELNVQNVAIYNIQYGTWCMCYTGQAAGLGGDYLNEIDYPQALAFDKLNDDEIVVGGQFHWAGPCQKIKNIGIFNKTTGTWRPLGTALNNGIKHTGLGAFYTYVNDVEVFGDTIYVVGQFNRVADTIPAKSFARYIVSTNTWEGFTNIPYGLHNISAMARKGRYMYLAGKFAPVFNEYYQTFTYLLKYDLILDTLATPELDIYEQYGIHNYMSDVECVGNYLITGGEKINMAEDCSFYGYNFQSLQLHDFPLCDAFGEIFDILIDGEEVYLAGGFSNIGGNANYRKLVKYNMATQMFTDMLPYSDNLFYGNIFSIDKKGHYLYLAGTIPYFGNLTDVRRVVAINLQNNQFIPFGTETHNGIGGVYDASGGSRVRKVKAIDNDIWFGGEFTYVNRDNGEQIPSIGIAKWNGIYIGTETIQNPSPQLSLFPNPANQVIHIHTSEIIKPGKSMEIQVFDMHGRMFIHRMYNQNEALVTLPISELNAGIYLIQLKTEEHIYTGKFIKQ